MCKICKSLSPYIMRRTFHIKYISYNARNESSFARKNIETICYCNPTVLYMGPKNLRARDQQNWQLKKIQRKNSSF